jgi:hypothetical protein
VRKVLRVEQPLNVNCLHVSKSKLADDRRYIPLYRVTITSQGRRFLFRGDKRKEEPPDEISNKKRTLSSAATRLSEDFGVG